MSGLDELRWNANHRDGLPAEIDRSVAALAMSPCQVRALASDVREMARKATALLSR